MRFQLSVFLSLFAVSLIAQPISKKGEYFLPEAGEYAISIDAAPFLFYAGNLFTQNGNQSPTAKFNNPELAISLKMFRRADLATRVKLRLGFLSNSWNGYQPEFSNVATVNNVKDTYNRSVTNIYLSYGIERRRGSTRIQGFYGVEGGLGLSTERHKFKYGNSIDQNNTVPNRTEFELQFQDGTTGISNFADNNSFVVDYNLGTGFRLGARAFIGAEMFIFPKVSLGVELGLGAMLAVRGKGTIETESWTIPVGGSSETLVARKAETGGSSVVGIDTDNSGGSINLNFHF
jgi:hypothetical protein